jgi:lysophospholipase L1-like esterase
MMMKSKSYILFLLLLFSQHRGFTQVVEHAFADDIRKFKTIDSISPPPQNPILFIGSSSFTMWKDVQLYFPGYPILNRGFGGSTFVDVIYYNDDILFPYKPKQVVIYCGENDFASSDSITPGMVNSRFVQLFELIRKKMPDVKITYISMKPSPSRWHLKAKFILSNNYIRKFLKKQPNTSFVDVWHKMLDKKGQPSESIFLEDQLHMNPDGYKIWKKAINPHLIK